MTETLGWGDVDVDEAPRRRRRLPVVLIWIVVAAVVVGITVWPTAKDTLANRAADWLQRQWHIAGAYEASRADIELTASLRLAAGDEPTLVRIVQALDREEADKLTRLAAAVKRHRLWAQSVKSTGRSVRNAFLAEARDLRADVSAARKLVPVETYVESPYSSNTETLVQRAGDQVQTMAHARHLKAPTRLTATLASAGNDLADLKRVTQHPVDMRLAVLHDSQLDVWDLETGQVRDNVIRSLPVDPPDTLRAVGSSLLVQFNVNWQLWPTAGPHAITLPSESPTAFYQPDGAGGLWRTDAGRIRRYDVTGHPTGPWHRYPANLEVDPLGATKDAIVSNLGAVDYNEPHPVLWWPDTGRVVGFDNPCPAGYETAGRTLAFTSCDQTSVHLLDTANGQMRTVHLPRGLAMNGVEPVMSPDGSKLAVLAGPRRDDIDATSLYVFDLKTGAVTNVQTAAAPIAWSPNGSVLVLDAHGDGFASGTVDTPRSSPLLYWQPGMAEPAGIRLSLSNDAYSVATLP